MYRILYCYSDLPLSSRLLPSIVERIRMNPNGVSRCSSRELNFPFFCMLRYAQICSASILPLGLFGYSDVFCKREFLNVQLSRRRHIIGCVVLTFIHVPWQHNGSQNGSHVSYCVLLCPSMSLNGLDCIIAEFTFGVFPRFSTPSPIFIRIFFLFACQ